MARTTRHFSKRMSQRGITDEIVNTVRRFGVAHGDKIILNKKGCRAACDLLEKTKRLLDEISETGGYVIVEANDALITTYRLNSFRG